MIATPRSRRKRLALRHPDRFGDPDRVLPAIVPAVLPSATPAPCCAPDELEPCVECIPATPIGGGEPIPPRDPCAAAELLDAGPTWTWPDWCDADVWVSDEDMAAIQEDFDRAIARDYLDRSDRLKLDELVEHQAAWYRTWNSPAGQMIARALDELALKIRLTDARSPAEYEARIEVLDADVRQQWEAIGYENGRSSILASLEPTGGGFGHHA
jgi:hypothetical protein